ncbi:MAG: DUF1559 domain-containing protein [Pirellulaceae bacterium]
MLIRNNAFVWFATTAVLCTTSVIHAQPDRWAQKIAPFVNVDDLLVAHADISKTDAKAVVAGATEIISIWQPLPAAQVQGMQDFAAQLKQQLVADGVSDVFVLANLQDIRDGKVNVIAFGLEDQLAVLQQGIGNQFEVVRQAEEFAFFGSNQRWTEIERNTNRALEIDTQRLAESWKQHTSADVHVALRLQDSLRVLTELQPNSSSLLGVPIGDLASRIRSLSLSASFQPKLSVQFALQANSPDDAAVIESSFRQIAHHVQQDAEFVATSGKILRIANKLTLVRQGDTLKSNVSNLPEFMRSVLPTMSEPTPLARSQTLNTVKQIALAHINFESTYGSFIPNASYDQNGRPLLSWRVYLLPYFDYQNLYEQFHLDEPWDSPHNIKLVEKMPEVFRSRGLESDASGNTCYLVPTGPGTLFDGQQGKPLKEVRDGTSKTLLVVEVAPEHAVPWTKPVDWPLDASWLVRSDDERFVFARADASAGAMPSETSEQELRDMALIDNGAPKPE